jgi:hypothetical protein
MSRSVQDEPHATSRRRYKDDHDHHPKDKETQKVELVWRWSMADRLPAMSITLCQRDHGAHDEQLSRCHRGQLAPVTYSPHHARESSAQRRTIPSRY